MADADDTTELVVERHGNVAVLRLNRPEARNALTPALVGALGLALVDADADPEVRAVVLTGTGTKAFCAGMDLRAFAGGDQMAGSDDPGMAGFLRFVQGEIATPVVGAANGAAVAGGLELLLGCDVVVASTDARFGLPEVQRGLFAAGGGTFIGQRIPLAVALEMALTGNLIDAGRAYQLGLVNALVPPGDVLDAGRTMADRIAANGPLGVVASKELVRLAASDSARARERQAAWQKIVFSSEDAQEGARAFVEKRPPVWTGK